MIISRSLRIFVASALLLACSIASADNNMVEGDLNPVKANEQWMLRGESNDKELNPELTSLLEGDEEQESSSESASFDDEDPEPHNDY